ncbi:DUF5991 domain-containing protein [Chryseobacterium gallinarum]|uniref:DUF5991 domain-containing protein n=1 Tax=Chryseobacterium gallinarum TaxID=1324352 RepID=UPI002023C329|nr:DUF5991 domain-containing protein [Chryseobacterium gallinarum]MCL8536271.1 DUF5991 domain-containing protein [Chryseobacterium gallinarum]
MQLNKAIYTLVLLLFISCKGDAQNQNLRKKEEEKKENKTLDFFDKKFGEPKYSLIIDESNIADHPIVSHLDCQQVGYFTIHYIPKTNELQNFWKNSFLKNYDFNDINLEKDNAKISNLLKNKNDSYNIFSYQIPKNDLEGNCTEENVYAKKDAIAHIYFYNSIEKRWNLLKDIKSDVLPPYLNSEFFKSNFPNYFKLETIKSGSISQVESNSIKDNHWLGNYNLNIDYGKLDNVSEMSIDYDIEISNDKCTFSGMGYKTYFTDLCKIEESGKQLILKYEKAIDGDGFSDHSNLTTLGTILYKEGKYYLKSPIVADKKWNYNSELVLTKKD